MSQHAPVGTAVGAGIALLASPYLARLSLSVPDRDDPRWWEWQRPGGQRLAATGAIAVVLGALGGRATGWTVLLPAWVALAIFSAPLSVIDFEQQRLPNRLVFPAAGAGALLLTLAAGSQHDWPPLLRAAEGGALVFGLFFALALVAPFGLGDVKLGGVLAAHLAFLGWGYVLYGIMAGFIVSSAASLPLVLLRKATMKTAIPLGPALVLGAFVVAAFQLVPSYLS